MSSETQIQIPALRRAQLTHCNLLGARCAQAAGNRGLSTPCILTPWIERFLLKSFRLQGNCTKWHPSFPTPLILEVGPIESSSRARQLLPMASGWGVIPVTISKNVLGPPSTFKKFFCEMTTLNIFFPRFSMVLIPKIDISRFLKFWQNVLGGPSTYKMQKMGLLPTQTPLAKVVWHVNYSRWDPPPV